MSSWWPVSLHDTCAGQGISPDKLLVPHASTVGMPMHTVLSLGSGRRQCLGLCLGVGNPMEQTRGCWIQSHRVHRVTSQSPLMTSLLSCFSSLPSPQRSSKQPRQHPERPDATDGCAAEIPLDKKQIAEGTRRPPQSIAIG
jgi:hypothetical protein